MQKLSVLERLGVSSLRRSTVGAQEDGPVHILTPGEQAALLALQRRGVARAAAAGALSALASVIATLAAPQVDVDPVRYWVTVGAVTGVATVFEIGFLYVDALDTVRKMAAAAGLALKSDETEASQEIALALARAALELPTPPRSVLGVDPRGEQSRLQLLLVGVIYKLKVTATNFLLKALLRRALGRFAARAYLEMIAIPVTALWNGIVTFWVFREARLRIIGPSAAKQLSVWIHQGTDRSELALRALACVTVKARDAHPNVEALAREVLAEAPEAVPSPALGERSAMLSLLEGASRGTQLLALRAAVAAALVDGRLTRRERALLEEMFQAAGLAVPWALISELRAHLVAGEGLREDLLSQVDAALTA